MFVWKTRVGFIMMMIVFLLVLNGCFRNADETAGGSEAEYAKPMATAETRTDHRIVSTTVAITEIMDALGIDLVGVPSSYKTLPQRYDGVTRVGNPMSPDMELIKSLKPTEVLSVTTLQYDLEPVFENAGIKADFLDLTSLEKMNGAILALGEKYGRKQQAEAIVEKFNAKLSEIKEKIKGEQPPTVLILLGVPGSYLVATEHSYIGDLVRIAGGKNVIQNQNVEYLASNTEYLHQTDPDVILRAAHGMPDEVIRMFDKEFRENDIWKHFSAVKNNRVYDLEETLFGTTGNLAAVEALDALVKMLYPHVSF